MGIPWNTGYAPSHGQNSWFDYNNHEAGDQYSGTCCGQAAALTIATYYKRAKQDRTGKSLLALCKAHPPDNLGGCAGTSWQRLKGDILERKYKLKVGVAKGETQLKRYVGNGMPCIIMSDVVRIGWKSMLGMGGHWSVVFGCNKRYVFLSNWQQPGYRTYGIVSWSKFNEAWDTWLTTVAGMSEKRFFIPYT